MKFRGFLPLRGFHRPRIQNRLESNPKQNPMCCLYNYWACGGYRRAWMGSESSTYVEEGGVAEGVAQKHILREFSSASFLSGALPPKRAYLPQPLSPEPPESVHKSSGCLRSEA